MTAKPNPWLDHWFTPGILTSTIRKEALQNKEPAPDINALKKAFTEAHMHWTASMVDFLSTDALVGARGLNQFGSGSIMPEGAGPNEPFSFEAASALQELYVGDPSRGITPLEWLGYFARHLDKIPLRVKEILDYLCRLTIKVDGGTARGDFEDVTEED